MQPLRNVQIESQALTAGGDVSTDLPVNPLLCIYYTLNFLQASTPDTTDHAPFLSDICSMVPRIEVLFRGTTIVSGSLADIMLMNAILTGRLPFVLNLAQADNGPLSVTFPIWLGRHALKGVESFPATRRGELTLRRVFSNPLSTKIASPTEHIETVEMLGGDPPSFLKYITIAKQFITTGDNDVDFPLGNRTLGALLFGTTGLTAQPDVATWSKLKLFVDGVEWTYARANWNTLHANLNECFDLIMASQAHIHEENLAGTYANNVMTASGLQYEDTIANYAYLDFDPWENEAYLLQTAGRGRVWLRATAGTADLARMLPLEIIDLKAPVTA